MNSDWKRKTAWVSGGVELSGLIESSIYYVNIDSLLIFQHFSIQWCANKLISSEIATQLWIFMITQGNSYQIRDLFIALMKNKIAVVFVLGVLLIAWQEKLMGWYLWWVERTRISAIEVNFDQGKCNWVWIWIRVIWVQVIEVNFDQGKCNLVWIRIPVIQVRVIQVQLNKK